MCITWTGMQFSLDAPRGIAGVLERCLLSAAISLFTVLAWHGSQTKSR